MSDNTKYFKVTVRIESNEESVENTFEVEAPDFDTAVANLENDLDVTLR